MANWNTLRTAVADVINTNGNQAITGQLLQNVLNNIITNVGENATFAGIATLDTNPGAPDGPVFYITSTAGTYPNFNGIEVQDGEAVILLWNNNAWSKKTTGFVTQEKLSELGQEVKQFASSVDVGEYSYNSELVFDGTNILVSSSSTKGIVIKVTEGNVFGISEGTYNSIVFTTSYPSVSSEVIKSVLYPIGHTIVPIGATHALITLPKIRTVKVFTSSKFNIFNGLLDRFNSLFLADGEAFFGCYKSPVYDIYVKSNGGYETIKLAALYKTDARFSCIFSDNNGNDICSYTTTDVSSIEGVQLIHCSQIANSGVYIDVIIDTDSVPKKQSYLSVTPIVRQKEFFILPIDYYKTSEGQNFLNAYNKFYDSYIDTVTGKKIEEIIEIAASESNSSRFTKYIKWDYPSIKLRVEKEIGVSNSFNLYTAPENGSTELTLIKSGLSFDTDYNFTFEPQSYLYLFSSSVNPSGFKAKIIYARGNSLSERIETIEANDKDQEERILSLESNTQSTSLRGKNIVCFGDSITEFRDSNSKGYCDYLSELSGATVVRGGIGGTRLSQRAEPILNPDKVNPAYGALDIVNIVKAWTSGDWTYVDAANEYLKNNQSDDNTSQINALKGTPISNTDIVTIFGGTNDFTGGAAIGESADTTFGTIYGAINNIVKMLLETNPNLKVYIFTPIVRYVNNTVSDDNWSDNYLNKNGDKLPDVASAVSEACKKNHIPCCNLYWELGWNQYNFFNYFNTNDTTHPFKGFKYLAEKMIKFLMTK